jgi:hypothetical protein
VNRGTIIKPEIRQDFVSHFGFMHGPRLPIVFEQDQAGAANHGQSQ